MEIATAGPAIWEYTPGRPVVTSELALLNTTEAPAAGDVVIVHIKRIAAVDPLRWRRVRRHP